MRQPLQNIALLVIVGVVSLRPLVTETYDSTPTAIGEALSEIGNATPVRTLFFDLLLLSAATVIFLIQALDGAQRYHRTGLEWGGAAILAAALISCVSAGNKRLAINGAIDWITGLLLAIALAQLLRQSWQRRLLVAALVGSACVQAFQCYEQRLVSFDETWSHYVTNKEEFWARQGVDPGSSRVAMFEARMRSREASGFLPHSNVTASLLLMIGLLSLGATIDRARRSLSSHQHSDVLCGSAGALVTLFIFSAIWFTGSRGAWGVLLSAVFIFILSFRARAWVKANGERIWLVGWMMFAGGVLAVVAHGLYHRALPGVSLAFRWQYWTAAARMIADHAWTGVSRENFGRHYLAYKSIESPEEVSNPHNLFVQIAADWGLLGLIGLTVMMLGASRILAASMNQTNSGASNLKSAASIRTRSLSGVFQTGWAVAIALFVWLFRVPLLGTTDPDYIYYTTGVGLMSFAVGFGFAWFSQSRVDDASAENDVWTIRGATLGLFAFLFHDMINFAMFVPQTMTSFFALLGLVLAGRANTRTETAHSPRQFQWLPFGVTTTALLSTTIFGFIPVFRANRQLQTADAMPSQEFQSLFNREDGSGVTSTDPYVRAAQADPYDPTPLVQRARRLSGAAATDPNYGAGALAEANQSLYAAIRRDPSNIGLWRMRASLHLRLAERTGDPLTFAIAVVSAKKACDLYPQDPHGLVLWGDMEAAAGEALDDRGKIDSAIEHYRHALDLDDRRLSWEKLRRMTAKERQAIEAKIERLQNSFQRSTTDQPDAVRRNRIGE